ncbi:MAG: Ppx/GppA family phosphatase [Gemmatimonadota bacterium]
MQAPPTPLAAVDVGTNTVRMLVAVRDRRGLRPVLRMRRITGMGRDLRETGAIGNRELRDSVAALRAFRREIDRLGVGVSRACGTAALRDASNRDAFLAGAAAAGFRVDVISPEEEARLTWAGVMGGKPAGGGAVVMDIGGGSTEFIAGPGRGESVSLPIGVVVLRDVFRLSDPPDPWQIRNLKYFLAERIAAGTRGLGRRRFRRLVGTAGTFTTLAALDMRMRTYRPERIDGYAMPAARVRAWEKRLCGLNAAAILALPGMEKGRERYMVPGICQAGEAMARFGAARLEISDAGLLEGIILGLPPAKQGGC